MSDSDISGARPGRAHPFSHEEIIEYDSRFTAHELHGIDVDAQSEPLMGE